MNPAFIGVNVVFSVCLIATIMGLSFGIILPTNLENSKWNKNSCVVNNTVNSSYYCCSQMCNPLDSCDNMMAKNQSGYCCASTCLQDNICNLLCDSNCTNITISLYMDYLNDTFSIECGHNSICIDYYTNLQNVDCWIDGNEITINPPKKAEWYIYYIIALFTMLLISQFIACTSFFILRKR